jgi:hypothetical protein
MMNASTSMSARSGLDIAEADSTSAALVPSTGRPCGGAPIGSPRARLRRGGRPARAPIEIALVHHDAAGLLGVANVDERVRVEDDEVRDLYAPTNRAST